MEVRSDRRFTFEVSRERLWAELCDVTRYPSHWPWLREFDGAALATGSRWRCVVQPPLPYRLGFDVVLRDVEEPSLVTATVSGDLEGDARLDLVDHPGGCEIRLTSHLAPTRRAVKAVALVAAPIARLGHDWVLETGARQLARALAV